MSKHSESQIAEREERLRQAMLKSNLAQLDALIASELIFTNHLGQLVSKQQDLAIHKSGTMKLRELTSSEQRIQIHEGFSVVSVKMNLLGSYAGTAINGCISYTRIWSVSSAGYLQIIAGHSSLVVT